MFIRDVLKELCRTGLIYVIMACMVGVGVDIALRPFLVPITPPLPDVAPAPLVTPPPPEAVKPSIPDKPPAVPESAPIPAPVVQGESPKARIVIVIDDMGMARTWSRDVVQMDAALTLAYLPYADNLQQQMDEARLKGHQVMLHMPMQPVGHENPGPNAITPAMTAEDVTGIMHDTLAKMGDIKAMNNHMGSAATADRGVMDMVMQVLAAKGMVFLDSVTTQTSQAREAALAHGVPYLARDLFLDHIPTEEAVDQALKSMEQIAAHKGVAIAIGHPRPATIKALRSWLARYDRARFEIVPLSAVFTVAADPLPVHMSVPTTAD
ncbi:MAG: divergent polysaccharide deacetylase family protein [Pseudomonadota bacterium]